MAATLNKQNEGNSEKERVVTLRVAESLQGKKVMNREQMESAKADLRARFIELDRQKTVVSSK